MPFIDVEPSAVASVTVRPTAPLPSLTEHRVPEEKGSRGHVDTLCYATAPVPVRDDLGAAHARAWDALARPGTWWTGAERVAIAAEVRTATTCALCRERTAALSPYTVAGVHDGPGDLPAPAVDAVHRVTTDPGRLKRQWFEEIHAAGLGDGAYVELIGLVTTVLGTDSFCRAIGVGPHALPAPRPGAPSRYRPPTARDEGAWVASIPSGAATGTEADLYADIPGRVPNVIRALSLVPDAVRTLKDLGAAHYMTTAQMTDLTHGRSIDRAQIELIAGRVSALRQCFY
jgi:hypothetical protein